MSIVLERNPKTLKFNRKPLKQNKVIPAARLESVVEKVEIATNNEVLRKNVKYCSKLVVLMLLLVAGLTCVTLQINSDRETTDRLLDTLLAARNEGPISSMLDKWIVDNYDWLQDYFEGENLNFNISNLTNTSNPSSNNSSINMSSLKQQQMMQHYKDRICHILEEQKIEDEISEVRNYYLDNQSALLVTETLVYLKKRKILVLLFWFAFIMIAAKITVHVFTLRHHDMNIFKNVSSILNIENKSIFCKNGYFWKIDMSLNKLELIEIYWRASKKKKKNSSGSETREVRVRIKTPHSSTPISPAHTPNPAPANNKPMVFQYPQESSSIPPQTQPFPVMLMGPNQYIQNAPIHQMYTFNPTMTNPQQPYFPGAHPQTLQPQPSHLQPTQCNPAQNTSSAGCGQISPDQQAAKDKGTSKDQYVSSPKEISGPLQKVETPEVENPRPRVDPTSQGANQTQPAPNQPPHLMPHPPNLYNQMGPPPYPFYSNYGFPAPFYPPQYQYFPQGYGFPYPGMGSPYANARQGAPQNYQQPFQEDPPEEEDDATEEFSGSEQPPEDETKSKHKSYEKAKSKAKSNVKRKNKSKA